MQRSWLPLATVLLLGPIALVWRPAMHFDEIRYQVGRISPLADTLEIFDSGSARFISYTNGGETSKPIGIFEATLSPDRMDSLRRLFANPDFASLKDHTGEVRSGELYTRVSLVIGTEKVDKLVNARNPIDPTLEKIISALENIARNLRSHPKQTLAVMIQSVQPSNGGFTASVSFFNAGSEGENLRSPLLRTAYATDEFVLEAWPTERTGNNGTVTIEPEIVEQAEANAVGKTPDVLRLDAKGKIEFQIRAKSIAKMKGSQMVRVKYGNFTESMNGKPLLLGMVVSQPVAVTIQ